MTTYKMTSVKRDGQIRTTYQAIVGTDKMDLETHRDARVKIYNAQQNILNSTELSRLETSFQID